MILALLQPIVMDRHIHTAIYHFIIRRPPKCIQGKILSIRISKEKGRSPTPAIVVSTVSSSILFLLAVFETITMSNVSFDPDNLQKYFLLGNFTGNDLWPSINVIIASYLLLLFLPRWKWTPSLTLIVPLLQSVLYVGSIFSAMLDPHGDAPDVDFNTLEGIYTLFQDPNVMFPAWIHYIIFDHLVSRMIVLDSVHREASVIVHVLVVCPCVIGTFMLGPTGFLGYMLLRQVLLPETTGGEKTKIL